MNQYSWRNIAVSCTLVFTWCLLTLHWPVSAQSVPDLINYQGYLTDEKGDPIANMDEGEDRVLEFNIYDASSGGSLVWGPQVVVTRVTKGHFNTIFGGKDNNNRSLSDVFGSANRYLGIKVARTEAELASSLEVSPRQRVLSAPYALTAFNGVPPGTVVAWAGLNAPAGWLPCDGAGLHSQKYPELFSAIGKSWGDGSNDADASTDFNAPDLRGRFLRGVDGTANRDPEKSIRVSCNLGANSGNAVGSVQNDSTKMPNAAFSILPSGKHRHMFNILDDDGGQASAADGSGRDDGDVWVSEAPDHTHGIGGGDPETRPLNAYVNWIIKF